MCILLETIWFTRLSVFCSIITSNMNKESCVFYYVDYRCLSFCTLTTVFSVLLRYTNSDYPFGIFWSLCCLFFFDIRILITPLVSFGHCVVCSSSIYRFWLLLWYLLAIHCVVCSSSIYGFWLPLWYLLAIVLSVLLQYTDSDYSFGIFWPLCCLFFFNIRILITPLVSFGHCVVCSSSIYGFWLLLWYLLAIVLSVLLRYMDSDYSFGISWPLCCLFFFDIWNLITPLVSSNSSWGMFCIIYWWSVRLCYHLCFPFVYNIWFIIYDLHYLFVHTCVQQYFHVRWWLCHSTLVVNTSLPFSHSWPITGFVITCRLTRQVSPVE